MKIAVCAAFKVGRELTEFVLNYGHPIEFVATLKEDMTYAPYISAKCLEYGVPHVPNAEVNSPEFAALVKERGIDVVLLLWWPTIVKKESIESAKLGWINLHPALLPYGRGKHPYYWAINDHTPFGVTIHFIDPEIDCGKVLFQKEIPVTVLDTGESLYAKSVEEIMVLFKDSYPQMVSGELEPKRIETGESILRYGKHLEPHSTIDLDKTYTARDLIDRIRGRTFLHGDSAHFYDNGKKYRIKVIIEES